MPCRDKTRRNADEAHRSQAQRDLHRLISRVRLSLRGTAKLVGLSMSEAPGAEDCSICIGNRTELFVRSTVSKRGIFKPIQPRSKDSSVLKRRTRRSPMIMIEVCLRHCGERSASDLSHSMGLGVRSGGEMRQPGFSGMCGAVEHLYGLADHRVCCSCVYIAAVTSIDDCT